VGQHFRKLDGGIEKLDNRQVKYLEKTDVIRSVLTNILHRECAKALKCSMGF
jgi:hypothetical protein